MRAEAHRDDIYALVLAELGEVRAELEHARAALAGDSEGTRMWMVDCATVAGRNRLRAERAEAALQRVRDVHQNIIKPLHTWVSCPAHRYDSPADALSNWDKWASCGECHYEGAAFCAACPPGTPAPCPTMQAATISNDAGLSLPA